MRFCSLIFVFFLGLLLASFLIESGLTGVPAEAAKPTVNALWAHVWLIFPLVCLISCLWPRSRRRSRRENKADTAEVWWERDGSATSREEQERTQRSFCGWEC